MHDFEVFEAYPLSFPLRRYIHDQSITLLLQMVSACCLFTKYFYLQIFHHACELRQDRADPELTQEKFPVFFNSQIYFLLYTYSNIGSNVLEIQLGVFII